MKYVLLWTPSVMLLIAVVSIATRGVTLFSIQMSIFSLMVFESVRVLRKD